MICHADEAATSSSDNYNIVVNVLDNREGCHHSPVHNNGEVHRKLPVNNG